MKKYIIPALRIADIQNEALLVTSIDVDPSQRTPTMDARRRARGRHNYDDVEAYEFDEEDEDF